MSFTTWDQIERDADYKALSPKEQGMMRERYFQKRIASTPEFRSLPTEGRAAFMKNWVAPKPSQAAAKPRPASKHQAPQVAGSSLAGAFLSGAKQGYDSTLTGSITNKAGLTKPGGDELVNPIDAFQGLMQNLNSAEGIGEGLASAAGSSLAALLDPAGLAVDAVTLGAGGKILKGAAPAVAKAAPHILGTVSGAIQGAGTAALSGADSGSALKNALMGGGITGLMGLRGRAHGPQAIPAAAPHSAPVARPAPASRPPQAPAAPPAHPAAVVAPPVEPPRPLTDPAVAERTIEPASPAAAPSSAAHAGEGPDLAPPPSSAAGRNPDDVIASDFFNFDRVNVAPEEKMILQRQVQEVAAREGYDPKAKVSFDDIRREAAAIAPEMLDQIRPPKAGETIHPAMREALRGRVLAINKEVRRIEREYADAASRQEVETMRTLDAQRNALEHDARQYINVLIPARTQDGRNLAFHRMMGENSFDPSYWLARARRMAHGDPMRELDPAAERRISGILARGQEASERLNDLKRQMDEQGIGMPEDAPVNLPPMAAPNEAARWFVDQAHRLASDEDGMLDLEKLLGFGRGRRRNADGLTPAALDRLENVVDLARKAGQDVAQARIDLTKELAGLERTPWPEVVSSLRKAGLLSSVKTLTINAIGGPVSIAAEGASKAVAAPVDVALSLMTGQRSVLAPSLPRVWRASKRAATQGFREAKEVMQHGLTRDQLAKMEIPREMNSGIPALDAYANFLFRTTSAPDRFAKVYAYESSLREQCLLVAKSERRQNPSVNIKQRAEDLYQQQQGQHADAAITAQAIADAEFATFTNKTLLGEMLMGLTKQLPKEMRPLKPYADLGIDLVMPFKQIPSSVAQRVLDYAIVGHLAKGATAVGRGALNRIAREGLSRDEQRAISTAIGQGAVGLGVMMTGAFLAQKGLMTGTYDPETRGTDEAAGRLSSSIKINGRWVPVGQVAPFGPLLVVGATLGSGMGDPAKLAGGVAAAVLDMPLTQGAKQLVHVVENPAKEGGKFAASLAGSAVPSALADAATILDGSGEAPEISKEFPRNVQEGIMARTPGLRQQLPRKVGALGRPVEAAEGLGALWRFNGKAAKEDADPAVKELVRLRFNVDAPDGKGFPAAKGLPINLSGDLLRDYKRMFGQEAHRRLALVIASSAYQAAGDDERRDLLHDQAIRPARLAARAAFLAKHAEEVAPLREAATQKRQAERQKRQDGRLSSSR